MTILCDLKLTMGRIPDEWSRQGAPKTTPIPSAVEAIAATDTAKERRHNPNFVSRMGGVVTPERMSSLQLLRLCTEEKANLTQIAQITPLKLLNLSHSWCSGRALRAFRSFSCEDLETLRMNNSNINQRVFKKLWEKFPRLKNLSCENCDKVNDDCMIGVLRHKHLETLNLRGCRNITIQALGWIVHIPKLRSLDLRDCPQITDKNIEEFVEEWKCFQDGEPIPRIRR